MDYVNGDALVTVEWLKEHLSDPSVVILDGTSHLPTTGRDGDAEFADKHIPGALRFNIDAVSDKSNPLPHMLPSAEFFGESVGAMGISNEHRIVVYDVYGLQSAARTWWMFRVFGHSNVAVLHGGLPAWEAAGHPIESGLTQRSPSAFTAALNADLVRGVEDILSNVESQGELVMDARAAGRFTGQDPEPRAGMRSGHIPGSLSLPFTQLLNPDRTFLPADALNALLDNTSGDFSKPLVASCGSGVTACVIALAFHLVGRGEVAVYDGSWAEWGARQDTPIETG